MKRLARLDRDAQGYAEPAPEFKRKLRLQRTNDALVEALRFAGTV
jgi:hypothetical protein